MHHHLSVTKNTSLSRSLLAGLVSGLIAAVLNAGYTFFYRKATDLFSYKVIEPLLMFVGFPLLFILVAMIFFEMVENLKRGGLLFTILFFLLMLVAVFVDLRHLGDGIQGLLLGLILITGLLISFLLPFLATHPRIFMDKEELSESVDD